MRENAQVPPSAKPLRWGSVAKLSRGGASPVALRCSSHASIAKAGELAGQARPAPRRRRRAHVAGWSEGVRDQCEGLGRVS